MTLSQYPVIQLNTVYHIGTLDAGRKGWRGFSYEGDGLSVSLHPEAWNEIARLGGLPWWQLKRDEGSFLDVLAMTNEQCEHIFAWGVARGWIEPARLWRVTYFDGDLDEEVELDLEDEEDARAVTEQRGAVIKEVPGYICTPTLLKRMLWTRVSAFAVDGVCMAFAEDELGLDGVWWNEILDTSRLSAPRGVIFNQRLAGWTAQIVNPDEIAMDGV